MKQSILVHVFSGLALMGLLFGAVAPTAAGHLHADPLGGDAAHDALFGTSVAGETVSHFVLQGGRWNQPGGPDSPVTITYSYNNLLDGGLRRPDGSSLSASFLRSSVEEALGLWAAVAPLYFVEVEDEGGPVVRGNYPDGQYGQIRFHHLWINGPDVSGQPPTVKAQAYFPSVAGNHQADIYYDDGDPWQEIGTLSEPDVLGAAVHEIGHTLGLGHTSIEDANMYWIFRRSAGLGTAELHDDDIAGIQALYGSAPGRVTPLATTIPEPASGALAGCLFGCCLLPRRRVRGWRNRSASRADCWRFSDAAPLPAGTLASQLPRLSE